MAVDISRVVLAAVEAALGDEKPTKKKGLRPDGPSPSAPLWPSLAAWRSARAAAS